jgi:hypothetical protein
MVIKTILIVLVVAVLLEDGMSVKKRTREEEEEDERVAKEVNATLAAEEAEKKREEDEKKKESQEKIKKEEDGKTSGEQEDDGRKITVKKQESQDKACPSINYTCPVVKPCPPVEPCQPCQDCPACKECPTQEVCPEVEPCQPCGPCPPIHCQPCPVDNRTSLSVPDGCPEAGGASMTTPVAIAVGAIATLLVTGMAAGIGLLLRYVSPFESGFLFVATITIVWYLSSHYPATARELGGQVVTLLREATLTLGHRVTEAIQRYRDQVCVLTDSIFPKIEFHVLFKKFALRFSM